MSKTDWAAKFLAHSKIDKDLLEQINDRGNIARLSAGARLFGPGSAPQNFLFLIEGTVKVQQVSEGGRELVLYRIHAGESCALTTACLLAYEDYQAEAFIEDDATALAIPRTAFDEMMSSSSGFRRFVFSAFSKRITGLFQVIEDVAFGRIDIRLAQKMLELSDSYNSLSITHQQLASELGTAREVISRQLNEFQRRKWIISSRGHIELTDRKALAAVAGSM